MILNTKIPIGIVSYGTRIPRLQILGSVIAQAQEKAEQKIYTALGVESKTVPGIDEDTITLSTASGFQALQRLELLSANLGKKACMSCKENIGALFIGSESHPYAVKPSGSIVAQALGIASDSFSKTKPLALADLQFACKAGTQAMQIGLLYVKSGFCQYALAIGTDTAQAKPGDVLEYTAGAGSASFILGLERLEKKTKNKFENGQKGEQKLLARLLATTSVATDTPDFWRRPYQAYPEHAGRFTADPGYFTHIKMAAELILNEIGLTAEDFEYCVFHTPNAKFPTQVAKELGFSRKQIEASLLVTKIGNTYAGSSMLGLAATLDVAKAGKKILVISYGSGSGSDAFIFETTSFLEEARKKWISEVGSQNTAEFLSDQLQKLQSISYEEYRVNSAH